MKKGNYKPVLIWFFSQVNKMKKGNFKPVLIWFFSQVYKMKKGHYKPVVLQERTRSKLVYNYCSSGENQIKTVL
jgi:hypothetical protein